MKNVLKGVVVSTAMKQTVVVSVDSKRMHPLYKKAIAVRKRYKAHDEVGVKKGDIVHIKQSRPYSKDTHWAVMEKLQS